MKQLLMQSSHNYLSNLLDFIKPTSHYTEISSIIKTVAKANRQKLGHGLNKQKLGHSLIPFWRALQEST